MDDRLSSGAEIAQRAELANADEAEHEGTGLGTREEDPDLGARAEELLRNIGWDPGQVIQTRIYALMPPAKKMELALGWRKLQIDILRRRLKAENPDLTPPEIQALLLRRIDWVREARY